MITTVNDNEDAEESDDDKEAPGINLENRHFKNNNFNIVLCNEDEVDNKLLSIFTEEIRHIKNVITKQFKLKSLNDIISLFLSPLIPVIVSAVNASAITEEDTIGIHDAINFIRCLIALSYYRVKPILINARKRKRNATNWVAFTLHVFQPLPDLTLSTT
jgi:hypothetical protein